MHICSNIYADVAFIVTRILERPDIQGKWLNACVKLIKIPFMMTVLAIIGHVLNKIFKMKNETHAYGIENVFKK